MRFLYFALFIGVLAMTTSCNSPADQAATAPQKKSGEHFPFDLAGCNAIKGLLDQYPQIEEFGYVFKDYEFLNNDLVVFRKPKNVTFATVVSWIDYKQKKYVDDQYFPKYYKGLIGKINVPENDFDQLRKKMTEFYIEGVINEENRKILFLNKPMGTYKGFVYSKLGRKALVNGVQINDITLKVVEEFSDNWFGFMYP